ncbi:hypothetical protein ABPG75_013955 [Micractinium tetrahymenae]
MTVPPSAHPAASGACAVAAAASADPVAPVGKAQAEESVAIFQRSWQTYQKLLEVDFLEHNLLYQAVQQHLLSLAAAAAGPGDGSYASAGGLRLVDLGCGDALQLARTLQRCGCPGCRSPGSGVPLASYTGVDVSAPALALAARHLAFLQPTCEVSLVEQDMDAFVRGCPAGSFDVAFASFAVHHLSTLEAKQAFLSQVARCLEPGGAFLLVDVFRKEGEDRGQYMQRYQGNMDEAVDKGIIEPGEAATVMEHILNFDYPEQLSAYQQAAAAAGFAAAECAATDSKQFGRCLVLRKAL